MKTISGEPDLSYAWRNLNAFEGLEAMKAFAVAFLLLLFSMTAGSTAQAGPPTGQTLASIIVSMDGNREYLVDVVEKDRRGAGRRLRISCLTACAGFARYEEPARGLPLGIFRLSDGHGLVVVTWGGATTTIVQVFDIQPRRAVKVFDRHSKSGPSVAELEHGVLSLETTEFPQRTAGTNHPYIARTWVWDGRRFVQRQRRLIPPPH